MFKSSRLYSMFLVILLGLFAQNILAADTIWGNVKLDLDKAQRLFSFEEIEKSVSLLIEDKEIARDVDGNLIIAGGLIKITPKHIQSFAPNSKDVEWQFDLPPGSNGQSTVELGNLDGIHVALDYLSTHTYFNELEIGGLRYSEFNKELRKALTDKLREAKAKVSYLRPDKVLKANEINADDDHPHVVVSLQYNNDKQRCMTTFFGAGFLAKELKEESMRARFIHSALTGKDWNGADLGACVTKCCQEDFKVKPLNWRDAGFEGNTVPVSIKAHEGRGLPNHDGYVDGVTGRNTLLNGIFATVVIPFPDMKWVVEECRVNNAKDFIEKYATSITRAIIIHIDQNRFNYQRK